MRRLNGYTAPCKVLSLLCVSLISFQSLPSPALGAAAEQASQPTAGHDGETIFRGLYFGHGAVAQRFPEIWKQERYLERKKLLTPEDEKRIEEIQNKIVADIRQKDKEFFDRFAKTMQSGDHVAIQKALDEATGEALASLRKQTGKDPTAQIVDASGVYRYVEFWEYVWLYFFFYVYEYVAAFIYFAPVATSSVEGVASMKGLTRLQREEWINLIANRLKK